MIKVKIVVGSRSRNVVAEKIANNSRIGVAVEDIDQKILSSTTSIGIIITDIISDSPAAKAGLRKGDVIVQLGFEEVNSLKDFFALEKALPAGKPLPIRVLRQGRPLFRSIVLDK